MKFCEKCGASLSDQAAFCSSCGSPLNKNISNNTVQKNESPQYKKTFKYKESVINITEKMDLYNSYRIEFRDLALDCVNQLKMIYNKQIRDLDTFLENFLPLYNAKLNTMLQKANTILLEKKIYSATVDSIREEHQKKNYRIGKLYNSVEKELENCLEDQKSARSKTASYIPRFVGHGKGLTGILTSAATGFVMNAAKDGIKKGLVNSAKVSPAKKAAIYATIDLNQLINDVFMDFWQVHMTLSIILSKNGQNIWYPSEASSRNASNIFINMTTPNFPQEQLLITWAEILKLDPYNKEYYTFMEKKYGESDDLRSIKNYFGYEDTSNPLIV